jgi:hypothetical protein
LRNFKKNQQNIQSAIFMCTEIFSNFFWKILDFQHFKKLIIFVI